MSDNSLEAVESVMQGDSVDAMIDNAIEEHIEETTQEPSEPAEDVKEETVEDEVEVEETEAESSDEEVEETESEPVNTEMEEMRVGMQKRIDRQTAANKALQEQVDAMQKQLESFTSQEAEAKESKLVEPNIDEYDTVESYKEAMLEYSKELGKQEAKAEMERIKSEELAQKQQAQMQEMQDAFNEREAEFRETVPDYDERVEMFQELSDDLVRRYGVTPTSQAIAQVLLESDNAPRLIHELGGNPDKAEQLMGMTPVKAAFELFKMSYGQKKLGTATKSPKSTKPAPAPIKGLKPSGKSSKGLADLSGESLLKEIGVR